jgi:hypothetical protein
LNSPFLTKCAALLATASPIAKSASGPRKGAPEPDVGKLLAAAAPAEAADSVASSARYGYCTAVLLEVDNSEAF